MNSSKRLSPKAFNDVKSALRPLLRGCSLAIIENITKIVHHCEWQEERLKTVERDNSELRQVKITEIIDSPPPQPFTQIREIKPPKIPLRERLKLMDQNSQAWRSCLKHNNLTHQEAIELINSV